MMAYVNSFVVSVIVNGKPQREFSNNNQRSITIPFGSEYKIRVKNQNYKRALVNVTIDGASIFSGGKQLVLGSQQSIDLERFVDELDNGRKFKFVSKEQAAKEGHFDPTSPEMGLLKVEFIPEMEFPSLLINNTKAVYGGGGGILRGGGLMGSTGVISTQTYTNNVSNNIFCSASLGEVPQGAQGMIGSAIASNNIGGTVEGGHSSQQFGESKDFIWWDYSKKTIIDIQMKGPSNEPINDFGLIGLASSIKMKGNNQDFKVYSVTTTTDGSISVIYR